MMQRKITILYTIPNFDTAGSGKALLNIVKRLDKNKFEPCICCMRKGGDLFKIVRKSGIPLIIFKYTSEGNSLFDIIIKSFKKSKFFKKHKFDIVHSFHYASEYSEALCFRFARAKWIYTKKNMSWGPKSWKIRSSLSKGIVIQNTNMAKEFFPKSKKIKLILRGVDITEFKPRKNKLKKQLQLPKNSKVILTVANLVPVKGIEYLIDAFLKIAKNKKDTYLLILGDNTSEYADELKQKSKKSKFSDRILFLGIRLNVSDYHHISDVFVLPTLNKFRREGCPVALLEAMSSGLPSFATKVPGSLDILREFPEFLIEPENTEDIKNKLNWYFSLSKKEQKAISKEIRNYIVNNYSIEKEVKRHEEFYLNVLKK